MPCAQIQVSVKLTKEVADKLALAASKILATCIGKPIDYCMATVVEAAGGAMGGDTAPVAFVRVDSIGGLSPAVNKKISAGLCKLISEELPVEFDRIYINFNSYTGSNWGFNGATF